jgi:putative DNA primase/helicase
LLARGEVHTTGIADLQGARLVVSSEIDEGRRLAEATVKQLTGGDKIKARFMRQDFFEFEPTHKLFIAANHRPIIRGTDHAIWRRIRLIPFDVVIPEDERDATLPSRLKRELPGVLNWAVQGCRRWLEHGLSTPDEVLVATANYRDEMDVLGAFMEDLCIMAEMAWVMAAELYHAYQQWCEDSGERPLSQRAMGLALAERGFDRRKHGPNRRYAWFGIGLVNPRTDVNPTSPVESSHMAQQDRLPYKDD